MRNYAIAVLLALSLYSANSSAQAYVENGGSSSLIRETPYGIEIGDLNTTVIVPGSLESGGLETGSVVLLGNAIIDLKNNKPGKGVGITDVDGLNLNVGSVLKECSATESLTTSATGTFIMLNTDNSTVGTRLCICIMVNSTYTWLNLFNAVDKLGTSTTCPSNEAA